MYHLPCHVSYIIYHLFFRVIELTRLSREIIYGSERIQVTNCQINNFFNQRISQGLNFFLIILVKGYLLTFGKSLNTVMVKKKKREEKTQISGFVLFHDKAPNSSSFLSVFSYNAQHCRFQQYSGGLYIRSWQRSGSFQCFLQLNGRRASERRIQDRFLIGISEVLGDQRKKFKHCKLKQIQPVLQNFTTSRNLRTFSLLQ